MCIYIYIYLRFSPLKFLEDNGRKVANSGIRDGGGGGGCCQFLGLCYNMSPILSIPKKRPSSLFFAFSRLASS